MTGGGLSGDVALDSSVTRRGVGAEESSGGSVLVGAVSSTAGGSVAADGVSSSSSSSFVATTSSSGGADSFSSCLASTASSFIAGGSLTAFVGFEGGAVTPVSVVVASSSLTLFPPNRKPRDEADGLLSLGGSLMMVN